MKRHIEEVLRWLKQNNIIPVHQREDISCYIYMPWVTKNIFRRSNALLLKKGRHLHYINAEDDTLVVMLKMMVNRIIMVKIQQGWLAPDRIDSVPRRHSLGISSSDIYSLCLAAMQQSASRTGASVKCRFCL